MQERHLNRMQYFREQANTSRDFYVGYVNRFSHVNPGSRVLEIGCGEGGNLLPFAESGCKVTGVDIDSHRIQQSQYFFELSGASGSKGSGFRSACGSGGMFLPGKHSRWKASDKPLS